MFAKKRDFCSVCTDRTAIIKAVEKEVGAEALAELAQVGLTLPPLTDPVWRDSSKWEGLDGGQLTAKCAKLTNASNKREEIIARFHKDVSTIADFVELRAGQTETVVRPLVLCGECLHHAFRATSDDVGKANWRALYDDGRLFFGEFGGTSSFLQLDLSKVVRFWLAKFKDASIVWDICVPSNYCRTSVKTLMTVHGVSTIITQHIHKIEAANGRKWAIFEQSGDIDRDGKYTEQDGKTVELPEWHAEGPLCGPSGTPDELRKKSGREVVS